jgi:hypothetical protein
MARFPYFLLIVSLLSSAGWAARPAFQARSGNPQVIVSVYDHAGVPAKALLKAEKEVDRLLGQASVSVVWVNCPGKNSGVSACGDESTTTQLIVRIVPRALTLSDIAYGAAFLGADGRGQYADVFFASVRQLEHEEPRTNQAQVLGYVIAHEIGHLLLGSNAHSNLGIMKPYWSTSELQSISMGRLSFTQDQYVKIHERLDAETQSAMNGANAGTEVTVISSLNQDHRSRPRLP